MSYPVQLFISGDNLAQIIDKIADSIVRNSEYTESDTEIIALRQCADAVQEVINCFVDLDSYPPGEPNTTALRSSTVTMLSGSTVTNGPETTF